jgi:hypothetical protein
VEADQLVTAFMREAQTRRPIAKLFPSAKPQLIIKDASVTQKIPHAIRFEAGSIEIHKILVGEKLVDGANSGQYTLRGPRGKPFI